MTTLNCILDFSGGEKFYRFGNADGKHWIVPARGMRTAMGLYQPSSRKGRVVKSLFPLLHTVPPVQKAIRAEKLHCKLQNELHKLLCNIFGAREIEFAIFEGTPCVHQKITMQLSRGKEILGYCKLSKSEEIKTLFEKESAMLTLLAAKGIKGTPRALYCGTMGNGVHLFIQSTTKSASSKVIHQWGALHEEFLSTMHALTKQTIKFEDSDFCNALTALEEHLHWLPQSADCAIIERAIASVRKNYCGKEVEFSALHGDFTPWNMFIEKGLLFVFDFEYAAGTYPPRLDRYHFLTQTAVFEKHWQAEDIMRYMQKPQGAWIEKKQYALYLLDTISRFTTREKKRVEGPETELFAIWCKLLKHCCGAI